MVSFSPRFNLWSSQLISLSKAAAFILSSCRKRSPVAVLTLDNLVCSAGEADEHWYHPLTTEFRIPESLRSALLFPEPLARDSHFLLRNLYPRREGEMAREMEPCILLPPYD